MFTAEGYPSFIFIITQSIIYVGGFRTINSYTICLIHQSMRNTDSTETNARVEESLF